MFKQISFDKTKESIHCCLYTFKTYIFHYDCYSKPYNHKIKRFSRFEKFLKLELQNFIVKKKIRRDATYNSNIGQFLHF